MTPEQSDSNGEQEQPAGSTPPAWPATPPPAAWPAEPTPPAWSPTPEPTRATWPPDPEPVDPVPSAWSPTPEPSPVDPVSSAWSPTPEPSPVDAAPAAWSPVPQPEPAGESFNWLSPAGATAEPAAVEPPAAESPVEVPVPPQPAWPAAPQPAWPATPQPGWPATAPGAPDPAAGFGAYAPGQAMVPPYPPTSAPATAVPYPVSGTPTTSAYPVSGYPVSGYPYPYPPVEGQPGYPYAVAPPPKRRTGLIIGVVVAVLLVMGGGGYLVTTLLTQSSASPATTPTTAAPAPTTPSPEEPSPTPTPSPTFFSGDLRTLLLPTPKGAKAWAKPISKDGNMTVDQYSTIFLKPAAAKEALVNLGYQRGACRQWHATDDTLVEIEIIQFDTERDAKDWTANSEAGARDGNADLKMVDRGELNSVENSAFMIASKADNYGYTFAAAFASKGNIMMEFKIWMPHKNEANAKKLAIQQLDKIPMPSL